MKLIESCPVLDSSLTVDVLWSSLDLSWKGVLCLCHSVLCRWVQPRLWYGKLWNIRCRTLVSSNLVPTVNTAPEMAKWCHLFLKRWTGKWYDRVRFMYIRVSGYDLFRLKLYRADVVAKRSRTHISSRQKYYAKKSHLTEHKWIHGWGYRSVTHL